MATELDTERGIVRVPTGTWTIDPAHSSVEFRVKHMMVSTVRGRFSFRLFGDELDLLHARGSGVLLTRLRKAWCVNGD